MADAGGPYFGKVNTSLQFYGYAVNGFPPYSWHWDFGDANTSNEQNPIHTYTNAGDYTVTLTVTDDESDTASDTTWALIEDINHRPDKPIIDGATSGKVGVEYKYTFSISDPDWDLMYVRVDWGSGVLGKWSGPYPSGTNVRLTYTWHEKGTYTIRAQTQDIGGLESEWGTLPVLMLRNKAININNLLLNFLQQHPDLFPILQRLLQRLGLQ